MPDSFLIDTSVMIALLRFDVVAIAHLSRARTVWLCSIVIGELHRGAFNSSRIAENLARIDYLVQRNHVLPCDSETARAYGEIKQSLLAKGRPIPENDVWIAAIARQHGLSVATRDADFGYVDGLHVAVW